MVANGIGPRVEEMETVINYQIKASKAEAESTAGCITNRAALFYLFGFDSKASTALKPKLLYDF